jgi:hypothetical protein
VSGHPGVVVNVIVVVLALPARGVRWTGGPARDDLLGDPPMNLSAEVELKICIPT